MVYVFFCNEPWHCLPYCNSALNTVVCLSEESSEFNFYITINYDNNEYTYQAPFNQNLGIFNSYMIGNHFGCKDRRIFYINNSNESNCYEYYVSGNPLTSERFFRVLKYKLVLIFLKRLKFCPNFL